MLLTGTNGDDTLTGGIGDDQISGLEGNDSIDGNAGDDTIDGGGGNDSIAGEAGNDTLDGGTDGNDTLDGGFGDDFLNGGDGDDRLDDWTGTNTLVGGLGNDYFVLRATTADVNSRATGGGGQDTYAIQTQANNQFFAMTLTVTDFAAGVGGDLLDFSAILDRSAEMGAYSGGNAFDPAQGFLRLIQSDADTLVQWDRDGLAGGSYTWATQVTLLDTVATNLTAANVVGGLDPGGAAVSGEVTDGTDSAETLTGTYGNDVLNGNGGNDNLDGQQGVDELNGGFGNDMFFSGSGDDFVAGGEGNDTFSYFKSYGNDTLLGEAGDDIFFDLYGDNVLSGGAGADFFNIYFNGEFASSTTATGGEGRDEYEFVDVGPQDSYVITDFEVGSLGDFIDIYGLLLRSDGYTGGNPFDPALGYVRLETVGDDTLFQHDVDGSAANAGTWKTILTLQGVTTGFTAENFDGIPPDGSPVPGESLTGTAGADNLTGGFFNDTLSGLEGTDQLAGAGGDDWLDGGADEDGLFGGLGNDTLIGGGGDDILDGSWGDDSAVGGAGNDRFYANGIGADTLDGGDGADYFRRGLEAGTLTGGAGEDTFEFFYGGLEVPLITDFLAGTNGDQLDVDSFRNYSGQIGGYSGGNPFASNLGYLRLLQSGSDTVLQWDIDGVAGSEYAWRSTIRLAGVDRDTITSDNFAGKLLIGTQGNDELVGGIGNDTLQGLGGDDVLDGSVGADSMEGGTGSDLYYVDDAGDLVVETSSVVALAGPAAVMSFIDTVVAAVTYSLEDVEFVENLTLSGTATSATGNELNNVITGNAVANVLSGLGGNDTLVGNGGTDTLVGGSGNDSMAGGSGSDIYVVNAAGDIVSEGTSGVDLIQSSVSIAVLAANVEKLTLTGSSNLNGTGNALANVLTGNAGANILNGGAGSDTIAGGAGNDIFVVNSTADVVTEASSGGTDLIQSSASIAVLAANVEKLTLTGSSNLNGMGNTLANTLTGNAGANRLNGGAGNDTGSGGGGNDTLAGGSGNDRLAGGTGADKFDFNAALSVTTNVDRITDFNVAADRMRLDNDVFTAFTNANVTLAKGAFYQGAGVTQAHDGGDRIIYDTASGNLYYDADGQGGNASKLFATLVNEAAITHADFFIVT